MPYLNFTTPCKMAHDTHHAMTFIHTYCSHKHQNKYTHIQSQIDIWQFRILGLNQAVGETVFIRFKNLPYEGLGHTHSANH